MGKVDDKLEPYRITASLTAWTICVIEELWKRLSR